MSAKMFNELYELDKKQDKTIDEQKRYKLLIKMLRTYNLIGLYNNYALKRQQKGE